MCVHVCACVCVCMCVCVCVCVCAFVFFVKHVSILVHIASSNPWIANVDLSAHCFR